MSAAIDLSGGVYWAMGFAQGLLLISGISYLGFVWLRRWNICDDAGTQRAAPCTCLKRGAMYIALGVSQDHGEYTLYIKEIFCRRVSAYFNGHIPTPDPN